MEQVLRKLAKEYQDLNGAEFTRIEGRYIQDSDWPRWQHIGRPVLIDDYFTFGEDEGWTDAWLREVFGSIPLSIAVTPDGAADALKEHSDGRTYFVEPLTEQQDITSFLASFGQDDATHQEVRYLQSQNGNIYNSSIPITELHALRQHIPLHVPFVHHSLGVEPDAVNLWIGDKRSVTSLHSDPYENIYHVIRGVKHFTLFPPTETCFFPDHEYPHATYTRTEAGLQLTPSDPAQHPPVRWLSFDPDNPPEGTRPLFITVRGGQTLYLPAGWNHHVRQAGLGEQGQGVCVALNWWYDVQMEGMTWVWLAFLRKGIRYLENEEEGRRD